MTDRQVLGLKAAMTDDGHTAVTPLALDKLQAGERASVENWILSAAPDGILLVSRDGYIRYANPAVTAIAGYEPHELLGLSLEILLPHSVRHRHHQLVDAYFDSPHSRSMGRVPNLKLLHRDGHEVPVDITLGYGRMGQEPVALVFMRDVTEARRLADALRHRAMHDVLTGLFNREQFMQLLQVSIAQAARNERHCAVLLLDLDDFKGVNDTYGHAAGDQVLIEVAARLRRGLRGADVVARLGGDEFTVLLTDVRHPDDAQDVANKLLDMLSAPFALDGVQVELGASIGIALCQDKQSDAMTLLRYADLAMYTAKSGGRHRAVVYEPRMARENDERSRLLERLRHALRNDLLELHYQPQVTLDGSVVESVEALLRWNDPLLGPVSPDRFIPVAEASGLILPMSDWVLEHACRQARQWMERGLNIRIAINMPHQQFRVKPFVEQLTGLLQQHQLPPSAIELEITESEAMTDPEETLATMKALTGMGVQLSLDDFGTGHSSLSHLKRLPVSRLKIDREFIRGIPHDEADVAMVRGMVALGRSLQMQIVAEGVETTEQLTFLQQCGVHVIQGWLIARALKPVDLQELVVKADHLTWVKTPAFNDG